MTFDVAALWRPPGRRPMARMSRSFRQPPAKVWEALTILARFSAWMGVEWLGDEVPWRTRRAQRRDGR